MPIILTKPIERVKEFARQKQQTVALRIQQASPWGFIIKWAITHWVTILLTLACLGFVANHYIEKHLLTDKLLQEELKNLNIDLEKQKEEEARLRKRIQDFENQKKTNEKDNKKLRDSLKGLTSEQLKAILLEYRERLMKKRGIK